MDSMEASCSPTKRSREADPNDDCAMEDERIDSQDKDQCVSISRTESPVKPAIVHDTNENTESDENTDKMQTDSNDSEPSELTESSEHAEPTSDVRNEEQDEPVIAKVITPRKGASSVKKSGRKARATDQKFVCPICDLEKVYKLPKKTYGVVCCAACPGYFRSFLNNPEQFYCEMDGQCETRDRRSEQACKACWLRACLQYFHLEAAVRDFIMCNYPPRLQSSTQIIDFECGAIAAEVDTKPKATATATGPANSAGSSGTVSSNPSSSSSSPSRTSSLSLSSFSFNQSASYYYNNSYSSYNGYGNRGPRVKRVCRSIEDVYRGLPRAMFPVGPVEPEVKESKEKPTKKTPSKGRTSQRSSPTKKSPTKSASKKTSKRKTTKTEADDNDDEYDSDDLPITEYIYRNLEKEMRGADSFEQD
jgi:hypothetical protein